MFKRSFPLSDFQQEDIANNYLNLTKDDPLHANYERPALLKIVGALENEKIAIAGSGPGLYAKSLTGNGNEITCIDNSQPMHDLAYESLGDSVNYLLHDLNHKIPIPDHSFTLIISPLTIQYVADLPPLFKDFNRILKPGGRVVFSTIHPFVDKGEIYFRKEQIEQQFAEFQVKILSYRRPLSHFTNAILKNNFSITGIHEPPPEDSVKNLDESIYNSLSKIPVLIFFEIKKEH